MKRIPYKTDQNHPQIVAYKAAVEKGKRDYHVYLRDGNWIVKKLMTDDIDYIANSKEEAIEKGDLLARNNKSSLFIHGEDWYIQDRRDYD
jgi:hypothetical protein